MRIPANAKYAIIEQMVNREDNLLNVKWLCEAAGVSRSGYYHYLQTAELRKQREQQDRRDFLVILEACNREMAGPTAPAQGLTLMGIEFFD